MARTEPIGSSPLHSYTCSLAIKFTQKTISAKYHTLLPAIRTTLVTMRLRISTVIPVLNEQDRVEQAVQQAWEAGSDEVIVADGGSTDATCEISQALSCTTITSRRGRAAQQNAGAQQARGEVLLFLHADTHLPPGGADQIRRLLADPSAGAGFYFQRIEAAGFIYRWLERGNAWRGRWGRPYGDQGLFFRRELFAQLGGFPDVPLLEDLLITRITSQKTHFHQLPGPLYVSARRWRRHGVLRQTARNWAILAAHRLGASPERLAGWYRPHNE